jgi:hypothetical protein
VPLILSEAGFDLLPGVTLTSNATASPTGPPASLPYAVELTGTLTLHEGATLSGLEVRPGANFPAVGDGIVTACAAGATAPAVVQDARVVGTNAGARFTNSVHQAGACPLTVARTLVEGGGKGIFVEATSTAVMRIDAGEVCGARDVGLYFFQVPSTVQVHVTNTTVHGNCATMDTPVLGGTRRAGGVVFEGALPSTDFRGNKVLDNQGDQVLVASTGAAPGFTLTGDSTASGNVCPAPQDANHFTCRDTTGAHVVVFSSGAAVSALGNFWFNVPPNLGEDYSANVDPKGTGAQLCGITDRACAGTPTSCP